MENLKNLRKEKNLTLEQLAQKLNLSRQVLSRYERGEREADYAVLKKIANFFDVSIDYLLGNSTFFYPDRIKEQSTQLSGSEQELLSLFRGMTETQKLRFVTFGEGLIAGADGAQGSRHGKLQ